MFHHILREVKRQASGQRAYRYVEAIVGYHRIQASPGFRAAAHYCQSEWEKAGVQTQLHSYPADYEHHYWGQELFPEWECQLAELELLEPDYERLASYAADKIAVIQRSASTPPGGITTELVAVSDSHLPAGYQDLDVRGKLVLIDGDLNQSYRQAVKERGALGLVTDRMPEFLPVRHRMDLGDALCYTSFWWAPGEARCFGFVVSPKTGERLRRRLRQGPLPVRAQVEARFFPGQMDVLEAFIPGQTGEEVVIVAHLCHPQASANDNASGAGAAMEAARCLSQLVRSGALPPPRRGMRFLLVPEVYGTNCYLSRNEALISGMVAALNLDMVGQNQELCGSVLLVEHPPRAMPSYTGALLESLLRELSQDAKNLAGTSGYALFRWATTPYSGGSDHYVFSDPTVGVPCPMLIQWPDKFYHTNQDTLDKVDPAMLERVVLLTAVYAYYLANAGLPEALFLGQELVAGFSTEVHQGLERLLFPLPPAGTEPRLGWDELEQRLRFLLQRKRADLAALHRLVSPDQHAQLTANLATWQGQLEGALAAELARAQALLRAAGQHPPGRVPAQRPLDAWEQQARELVPTRQVRGPSGLGDRLRQLGDEERTAWEQWNEARKGSQLVLSHALFWMDGERDLLSIADLVEKETGQRDVEALIEYARMLERLGMVRLQ